jgi:hypothetical protein
MNKDDFNVMTELPFVFVENLVDSDSDVNLATVLSFIIKNCRVIISIIVAQISMIVTGLLMGRVISI